MSFVCDKCGKNFHNENNLTSHVNKRVPCMIDVDDVKENKKVISCVFCNNIFSNKYSLGRHKDRCVVRNDLELVEKRLAEQTKIVLELKNNINIKKLDKSHHHHNDNSKHDNSKHVIVNGDLNIQNIMVKEIYSFTPKDITFLIEQFSSSFNGNKTMSKFMKLYDQNELQKATNLILNALHNNPDCKYTRNILYCNHGEHKGKFMTYQHPEWFLSSLESILAVIRKEVELFIENADIIYENNDIIPPTMQNNINFINGTPSIENMNKYSEFITNIIKEFISSKSNTYPTVSVKNNPFELSTRALHDKEMGINVFDIGIDTNDLSNNSAYINYQKRKTKHERLMFAN